MKTNMMAGPDWQDKYQSLKKVGLSEARAIDQKYYWPDKPCHAGHLWWRRTINNDCVFCSRRRMQERRLKKSGKENRMMDIDAKRAEMALRREIEDMDL